ncbi:unnamed protein product [Acanthoscelides obtectus]|uniref:C2H2-type domain-containing protein n=1 Tax=Acanthoscelides obtectus TaxID=200917 RepID=A0A9P0JZC1_ACAOB|nr:unnamed protein product [Acanthoscelides obtectus]CAK1669717.1 hypothetical protein AOBTE_LOCUS27199 [Acanthoscelides obtectus]
MHEVRELCFLLYNVQKRICVVIEKYVSDKRRNLARASCTVCKKTFKNLNSLRAHINLDCMKSSIHKCMVCSFTSKRRFNLKMHYMTKHKFPMDIEPLFDIESLQR